MVAVLKPLGKTKEEPNVLLTSLVVFSSSMSAMPTAPKLQPARVKETQGAGMFEPSGCTRFGTVEVPLADTVSVQYWNVLGKLKAPAELVLT